MDERCAHRGGRAVRKSGAGRRAYRPHGIPDIGYGIVPENYNSYVVDNVSAVASRDAQRAAQQVLRTDAIPASVSAGAALHAAAQLLANCNSRAALAIFSGRASIV